jgi:hypothetical protein
MVVAALTDGEWSVIAALIAVVGATMFAFIAFFLRRLVGQFDQLDSKVDGLHDRMVRVETKVSVRRG